MSPPPFLATRNWARTWKCHLLERLTCEYCAFSLARKTTLLSIIEAVVRLSKRKLHRNFSWGEFCMEHKGCLRRHFHRVPRWVLPEKWKRIFHTHSCCHMNINILPLSLLMPIYRWFEGRLELLPKPSLTPLFTHLNVSQMPLPAHLLEEFHACQRLDGRKRINFDQMSFNRNLLFRYSWGFSGEINEKKSCSKGLKLLGTPNL